MTATWRATTDALIVSGSGRRWWISLISHGKLGVADVPASAQRTPLCRKHNKLPGGESTHKLGARERNSRKCWITTRTADNSPSGAHTRWSYQRKVHAFARGITKKLAFTHLLLPVIIRENKCECGRNSWSIKIGWKQLMELRGLTCNLKKSNNHFHITVKQTSKLNNVTLFSFISWPLLYQTLFKCSEWWWLGRYLKQHFLFADLFFNIAWLFSENPFRLHLWSIQVAEIIQIRRKEFIQQDGKWCSPLWISLLNITTYSCKGFRQQQFLHEIEYY